MLPKTKKAKIPKKAVVLPIDCCISEKMFVRLNSLGANGRLEWSLTDEQIAFIKKHYSYSVIPYLYRIRTQKFDNCKNKPAIIKKITKGAYAGKKFINTPLKQQDIVALKQFEISFSPLKYAITSAVNVVSD